jgi:thiamine-monophosphate kinase
VRNDELRFVESLRQRFGGAAAGETWIGDDAAVLRPPAGPLLLCIDPMIEGVHFLPAGGGAAAGWKAVARNVSDIAAMGGRPLHAVVSAIFPNDPDIDVGDLTAGLADAHERLCPIVGGDTSGGPTLTITVAVTGTVDDGGAPVLRSGARPGDAVFVTGPLGLGVVGWHALVAGERSGPAVERYTRPDPRVAEGTAARLGGATAMIDVSDGLALDLRRVAAASGVGVVVDDVPVADGATRDEAMTGGDDYELVFTAPDVERVRDQFRSAGLRAPVLLGRIVDGDDVIGLPEGGWRHEW